MVLDHPICIFLSVKRFIMKCFLFRCFYYCLNLGEVQFKGIPSFSFCVFKMKKFTASCFEKKRKLQLFVIIANIYSTFSILRSSHFSLNFLSSKLLHSFWKVSLISFLDAWRPDPVLFPQVLCLLNILSDLYRVGVPDCNSWLLPSTWFYPSPQ